MACEGVVHVRWGGKACMGREVGREGAGRMGEATARSLGAAGRGRDRYAAAERAEAGQRRCAGAVGARKPQRGRLAGLVGTRAACDGRLLGESQNAPRVRYTLGALVS